jgi:hypothetical protein
MPPMTMPKISSTGHTAARACQRSAQGMGSTWPADDGEKRTYRLITSM